MSSESKKSRSTFSDELSSLIDQHSGELSTTEISGVLHEYSEVLAHGSLAPKARIEGVDEPFNLELVYASPVALERDLNNLLELQGIVIELDRDLPALADLRIDISIEGFRESVELTGRPVSETAAGTALQIAEVGADTSDRLRSLPDRARAAAAEAADNERAASQPTRSAPGQAQTDASGLQRPAGSEAASTTRSGLSRNEPYEAATWTRLDAHSMRDALVETALRSGLWVLDVQSQGLRIQMLVTKGQLRDIRRFPRAKTDCLEILLHEAGKLDDGEVDAVQNHIAAHGGGASEALLERAIMNVSDISVAESTRLRFVLERVWSTTPELVRVAELHRLPRRCLAPARHALDFVFHLLRDEELEREDLDAHCRERLVDKTFRVSENPPFDLSLMSLSPKEKSTIELLSRAPLRFDDALRMSVLPEPQTLAFLLALDELGLLDTKTVRTWTRKQTRTMERISIMHAKLDHGTHFDILGVHWSAFGDEIEDAYRQLVKQVSREALDDALPDEIDTKAAQVRERLEQAHEVLSNRRRRASYRSEVVDQFKLRTSIQMFEKQADTAKMRRDIEGAIDFYRRILELEPKHVDAKRDLEMLKEVQRDKENS
jgi:hypothetical protein